MKGKGSEATAGRCASRSETNRGAITCFANNPFPKIFSNYGEPISRVLHLLEEPILILGIVLQIFFHFQDRPVFRSTLGTFLFIIAKAPQMERVHAHEMNGWEIKGESACSALA